MKLMSDQFKKFSPSEKVSAIGVTVACIALPFTILAVGFTVYNTLFSPKPVAVAAPGDSLNIRENKGQVVFKPTGTVIGTIIHQEKIDQRKFYYEYKKLTPASSPSTKRSSRMHIAGSWQKVLSPAFKLGDTLRFAAVGKVQWGYANQTAGPEGTSIGIYPYVVPPVDDRDRVGALIGRFGNGKPFIIGEGRTVKAQSGSLLLAVNDAYPNNNSGGFDVIVERTNR